MASPSVEHRMIDWRVIEDMRGETLSDHLYIEVVMETTRRPVPRSSTGGGDKR